MALQLYWGGGKFRSGAITGSFSYLFNDAMHGEENNVGEMVEINDPLDPSRRILVGREYANEILQGRAQGIDFSDPVELRRFRADSSCVASCVTKDFLLGQGQEKSIELGLDAAATRAASRGASGVSQLLSIGKKCKSLSFI